MIRNVVLEDIRSSIHSRPIPWKGLNRAHVVTDDEVQSFESLGKLNFAERVNRVQSLGEKYAETLIQLLSKDIRDDLVRYLVLFVVEYGSAAPAFAESLSKRSEAYTILTAKMGSNDEQITLLSAVSVSLLASANSAASPAPPESMETLFKYIIQNLLIASKPDANYKELGAQLLSVVLQEPSYRTIFYPLESEAVPAVLAFVASASLQVQYTSLLVLWVLSFDRPTAIRFANEFNVVPVVLDTAKDALKEKIVRLSMAIIANLLRLVPKTSTPVLMAEGALSTARLLEARKWNDDELIEDLNYVRETLTSAFESMTTFEEYSAELKARRLRWTPVHKNQAFWIENIDEFKDHDWAPLKQIVQLILESNDSVTLAVACHDIAAIIEQAPEATQVITRVGGKTKLLELIANSDAEVRYEALKATQKMISHIFV